MVELLRKHKWSIGAELGIDRGWLSRKLLDARKGLTLIGVDNFSLNPQYRHEVEQLSIDYGPRFRLLAMDTMDAVDHVEDGSLDFAFLDADHSESATVRDIQDWQSKVKRGGWMGGDAYNPEHYPQVVAAVHRVFSSDLVRVYPGRVWGVWC